MQISETIVNILVLIKPRFSIFVHIVMLYTVKLNFLYFCAYLKVY